MARDTNRARRLLAAASAVALVATACGDGGDEPSGEETTAAGDTTSPTDGGDVDPANYCGGGGEAELVWAHEQEPPDMHLDDPNNNLSITSWVRQSLWDGLYGIAADITFFPELLAEEATVNEADDGSVTIDYTLRDGLTWSDGTPLTSEHVEGTLDIIMEGYDVETGEGGVYLIGDRTGYDLITDFTVNSDTEFTVTMSQFFAGYKTLFGDGVFPTHVFSTAEEANAALAEWEHEGETLPSSGPMVFDSWQRGNSMTLTRNDSYHGSVSPDVTNEGVACVTGVRINWVADTDAQINALKAGEADVIFTQPQTAFGERISTDENFTIASAPGPIFEHWGFNLNNPHLAQPQVREAIAYGIDKSQVMSALYTPIFGDALPPEGLGNTYWMSNQPAYEDHQTEYAGAQVDQARAKLEEAGYTEGAGGTFEHPELGPLSLRVGTTGGNALRELQQQLIVEQLRDAGIEVTIDNVPGGDYFSSQPFHPDALACANSGGTEGNCELWDIAQFAWVGGPWPGSQSASYRTGSGNNAYGFANDEFDAMADECDRTVDEDQLAACYLELDMFVTTLDKDPEQGLVVIPLTQKPDFYAYSNVRLERGAIAPDADAAGPIVNVVDYLPAG